MMILNQLGESCCMSASRRYRRYLDLAWCGACNLVRWEGGKSVVAANAPRAFADPRRLTRYG